jgi:hypothetical protein
MYRHIRSVRDQRPVGVHQRATEVQPFLDVGRDGRLLQGSTHRFSNRHEAVGAVILGRGHIGEIESESSGLAGTVSVDRRA